MRRLLCLLTLLPGLGLAQGEGHFGALQRSVREAADMAAGKPLAQVSKPDILMTIKPQTSTAADLVTISAIPPNYPVDLLRSQIETMSANLGVPPRGLIVGGYRVGNLVFTKASFGTNGIIDPEQGTLRLTPILKAFVGAPAPYTVQGMIIIFDGVRPTERVLRAFSSPNVRIQATTQENPPQIEYRVQFLTQKPEQVSVPDEAAEQKPPANASTVQQGGVDWSLWIPLVAAALAASVLAYFVLLRLSSKPRNTNR